MYTCLLVRAKKLKTAVNIFVTLIYLCNSLYDCNMVISPLHVQIVAKLQPDKLIW